MIRLILLITLCFTFMLFIYQNHQHPQVRYNQMVDRVFHPLDTRVRYRVGNVDPRFGLSHTEVKQLAQQATQIWQQGTGKEWFVYDEHARLTIHLIYDERQQNTIERQQTQKKIDQLLAQHDQDSAVLSQEKARLTQQGDELEERKRRLEYDYQQLQSQFNLARGDTQRIQYLEYQKLDLEKRKANLNLEIESFNQQQQKYNQQVNSLNKNASYVNQVIDQSQTKFQPRQFHKGVFNGYEINIYEFSSLDDLRLTLAHEFGHALGLDHNNDPLALMYPTAQQQNLKDFKLMPADIVMLQNR